MSEIPLRDYVERLFEEERRHNAAQVLASQRALEAAAHALEAKLESMNEFRQQITDERALYVRREQLAPVVERTEKLERWQANLSGRLAIFGVAVVILASLVTLALRLVGH